MEFGFHLCKTDDIEPLENMSTVGQIAKYDNVISNCILQQSQGLVRAMPIHQKDMGSAIGLFLSLRIKVILHLCQAKLTIC